MRRRRVSPPRVRRRVVRLRSLASASALLWARVREAAPHGLRFVLDTSDSLAGLNTGVSCLSQGGTIGIVSAPQAGASFPFSTRGLFDRVANLQCIVQGSSVPQKFLPHLLRLHEQGRFPYDKLVTTYEFAAINEALADIKSGKAIKPVLVMSERSPESKAAQIQG